MYKSDKNDPEKIQRWLWLWPTKFLKNGSPTWVGNGGIWRVEDRSNQESRQKILTVGSAERKGPKLKKIYAKMDWIPVLLQFTIIVIVNNKY